MVTCSMLTNFHPPVELKWKRGLVVSWSRFFVCMYVCVYRYVNIDTHKIGCMKMCFVLCFFLNRVLWIPKLKTGYWSLHDAWTPFTTYRIFKGNSAWPSGLTFGNFIMSSGTSIRKNQQGLSLQGVDPETCMIVFTTHWAQVMLLSFINL